jgi:toxin ParE1/3/4
VSHRIDFSPEAIADLLDLYDYIAARAGATRAIGYISRLEDFCHSLSTFPERGTRRDDLRPGLRVLGFERRAIVAIRVAEREVTILRVLYGGQDIDMVLV